MNNFFAGISLIIILKEKSVLHRASLDIITLIPMLLDDTRAHPRV